jgi:hypothetical protein
MEEYPTELYITMSKNQLRVFHNCLVGFIERWPGGDPREQAMIDDLLLETKRALLEYAFDDD